LNREIRRSIPKGTDIGTLTKGYIKHVQEWVNSYPREIFEYATSEELFQKELQKVA
jgi:IS30 family transposase